MRRWILLVAAIGVFGVLGRAVLDAEALIRDGDTVLLALAPADPRSLMQGDYMTLRWDLERTDGIVGAGPATAVLAVDGRGIATFRRLAAGEATAADERRFDVHVDESRQRLVVEPHSFLFQEGRADAFARAKFGVFRVTASGRHLLVGLADAEGRTIDPK